NHPFIKKFVEERELTLMLVVDVSGSGLFGSRAQSKRELAAEIASVLAFSAIRNNDKVGLLLFTDEVEKFIPPRKGRGHVLRVIREVLFFEPKRRGTDLVSALEFMGEVLPHKAIAVVISDFILPDGSGILPRPAQTALRIANRRHDVVAVQIADRFETELPALGRLILEDSETGEILEINTGNSGSRDAFTLRQQKQLAELARQFRSSGIDSIQLRTDEPYSAALGKFFETRERRRLRG
ncbi:MAG TPA: VWA domain-containing protein, partial [Candidatus Baltobacteraceae bacterium]|nr:VWA domain-containing protein [Candidatus Baltobacteraceae bacterium]